MDYKKEQKKLEENYVLMISNISEEIEIGIKVYDSVKNNIYQINSDVMKEELLSFLNFKIFISINVLDIGVLSMSMNKAKYSIEQNLYARLLSIQIYEFINDYSKFNFKNISSFLEKEPQLKLKERFYNYRKSILNFYEKNGIYYSEIRNSCGAHKNKNARNLYENIIKIDCQEQSTKTNDLLDLMVEFIKTVDDILEIVS